MDGSLWPQRWFIRNTSNDLLTDRITDQNGFKNDRVTLPKPAVTFPNSAVTMPKRPVTMDRNTQQGQAIGALDTMIAAHALASNAILVTNNTREFDRVPGLRLENWVV
jgi:hypothetical protein